MDEPNPRCKRQSPGNRQPRRQAVIAYASAQGYVWRMRTLLVVAVAALLLVAPTKAWTMPAPDVQPPDCQVFDLDLCHIAWIWVGPAG